MSGMHGKQKCCTGTHLWGARQQGCDGAAQPAWRGEAGCRHQSACMSIAGPNPLCKAKSRGRGAAGRTAGHTCRRASSAAFSRSRVASRCWLRSISSDARSSSLCSPAASSSDLLWMLQTAGKSLGWGPSGTLHVQRAAVQQRQQQLLCQLARALQEAAF